MTAQLPSILISCLPFAACFMVWVAYKFRSFINLRKERLAKWPM